MNSSKEHPANTAGQGAPRCRPDCCEHPERHTEPDWRGWWRHTLPDHVASMLGDARKRSGRSWSRIEAGTGISGGYLRQLVAGTRAPGIEHVDAIADGFALRHHERDLLAEYAVHDRGRFDGEDSR